GGAARVGAPFLGCGTLSYQTSPRRGRLMATTSLRPVLQFLRRRPTGIGDPTDAELLRRYTVAADGAAFAELVARHGPMVWGVCRRARADAHAAEDAFQAAFLALARHAASVRRPESLAAWLHGVAGRAALKARERLRRLPQPPGRPPAPDPLDQLT